MLKPARPSVFPFSRSITVNNEAKNTNKLPFELKDLGL